MPQTPHVERHFTSGEAVRDIVIGMSDGLTVPFALAAGLSGAVASTHIVVTAGLAEVAAGAIAMGLGGFLAARSDADHYRSERKREELEIATLPEVEALEIEKIFESYGLEPAEIDPVVQALRRKPSLWAEFMMRFGSASRSRIRAGPFGARSPSPGPTSPGGSSPCCRTCSRGYRRRAEALGRLHGAGSRGLRLREGAIHGRPRGPQRPPDAADRRARRGRGLCDRAGDRLTADSVDWLCRQGH